MPETGKGNKDEIIRESMTRIIKGSETVALQAVDSAAAVIKKGLDNFEELTVRTGDILLNTARRAIDAGNVVASDVRGVARNMIKETIQTASEIGGEVKEAVSSAGSSVTVKPKEKIKPE